MSNTQLDRIEAMLNTIFDDNVSVNEIKWALQRFQHWMRQQMKHLDEEDWPQLDFIYDQFFAILDERGIDIYEEAPSYRDRYDDEY